MASELADDLAESVRIIERNGRQALVDLSRQPTEDLARADLDDARDTELDELLNRLGPAHGGGHLGHEQIDDARGVVVGGGLDVRDHGDCRRAEGEKLQHPPQARLHLGHQAAVKGSAHLELDGAPGAGVFAELTGTGHGAGVTGDDRLLGAVEVGRGAQFAV